MQQNIFELTFLHPCDSDERLETAVAPPATSRQIVAVAAAGAIDEDYVDVVQPSQGAAS